MLWHYYIQVSDIMIAWLRVGEECAHRFPRRLTGIRPTDFQSVAPEPLPGSVTFAVKTYCLVGLGISPSVLRKNWYVCQRPGCSSVYWLVIISLVTGRWIWPCAFLITASSPCQCCNRYCASIHGIYLHFIPGLIKPDTFKGTPLCMDTCQG